MIFCHILQGRPWCGFLWLSCCAHPSWQWVKIEGTGTKQKQTCGFVLGLIVGMSMLSMDPWIRKILAISMLVMGKGRWLTKMVREALGGLEFVFLLLTMFHGFSGLFPGFLTRILSLGFSLILVFWYHCLGSYED